MGENENVAKMADLASKRIFTIFGWEDLRLRNRNWACVEQEKHKRLKSKTHPSDVVFRYPDPYSGKDVYVNTDLKSYKATTLQSVDLKKGIRSLANAIECASKSEGWQSLYLDETRNHEIIGMLFVYNHDGEFDGEFESKLESLTPAAVELPCGRFLGVVSPKRVLYLNSVANDIQNLIADKEVPQREECHFFFPHLIASGAMHQYNRALPLPHMLAPLILFGYQSHGSKGAGGVVAYFDGIGESIDEFKYLLDYFIRYQIADGKRDVQVRLWKPKSDAASLFEKAKREFVRDYWPLAGANVDDANEIIGRIKMGMIQTAIAQFSEDILGMDEHKY